MENEMKLSTATGMTNCHTHIFTADHVPERFLPLRLVRWLARKKHFKWFAWILNNLNPFSRNDLLERYVSFMRQGMEKTQEGILRNLMDFYPSDTKFVILTMDMEYMNAGNPKKSYTEQLDEIVKLLPAYHDRLYPFVFSDPRRPDLFDFVRKYIESGFRGIKIYPPLGYFPFDERLNPVYEYAVAHSLPVTTHCSTGGIYTRESRKNLPCLHPVTGKKMKWQNRKSYVHQFTDPDNFRILLERFPELKVCFGHFGGTDEMDKFLAAENWNEMNETWFQKIKELLKEFPNTYADISFTKVDMSLIPLINATIESPLFKEKILFGTDFYMNKIEGNESKFSIYLRDALGNSNFQQIAVKNPQTFLK